MLFTMRDADRMMHDILGDAVKSFSVASGLLAYIHLHEAHSKAVQPPDQVQQPPFSNNSTTCNTTTLNAACQLSPTADMLSIHPILVAPVDLSH